MNNIEKGKLGEEIALKYILSKGGNVIEKNYRTKMGEVDLIAKLNGELVFVEVKTRTNTLYGKPVEAVNEPKQKHLISTAKYYLYSKHLENEFVRLDVIEVYLRENSYKINHIKQII